MGEGVVGDSGMQRGALSIAVLTPIFVVVSWVMDGPALAAVAIATGAAVASVRRTSRSEHPVIWMSLSVFTGSMAANTAFYYGAGFVAGAQPAWLDPLAAITLASCAFSAGLAIWFGARPLLAQPATRRVTLAGVPAVGLVVMGILLHDASYNVAPAGRIDVVATGLSIVALPILAGSSILMLRQLLQLRRRAEAAMLVGAIGHASAHTAALISGREEGIWLAIALSAGSVLVAATMPSAAVLGSPLKQSGITISVRAWPAFGATGAALIAWVLYRFPLGDLNRLAPVAIGIALITSLFASRELAGPRKPLVVPLGRTDRTLQQLPSQLLRGSVRLVGRPVRRASDGSIVGIEAEPTWSRSDAPPISLVDAAAAAGLDSWLQEVTIASARSHLPTVLRNLEGDDPFLSVPFDQTVDPPQSHDDDLDGLLLRIASTSQGVVRWQDRGAMVQISAARIDNGAQALVDVVDVGCDHTAPPTAVALVRTDHGIGPGSIDPSRLVFIVDQEEELTDLGVILSAVDDTESGVNRVDQTSESEPSESPSSEGVIEGT